MNTYIITQARMTSSRLPGKVMMKVGGLPVIHYHIERLKQSGLPIIVATTENQTDDPIVDWCSKNNVNCFRGDENDVLKRYFDAASHFNAKRVIRVTSDCPLIDGAMIAHGNRVYTESANEELFCSNTFERLFPRGFDFAIFTYAMLKEAHEKAEDREAREHVTPYFRQNRSGNTIFKTIRNSQNDSDLRVTLDQKEDFDLIEVLISHYAANEMSVQEIIKTIRSNSELMKLNSHITQKL